MLLFGAARAVKHAVIFVHPESRYGGANARVCRGRAHDAPQPDYEQMAELRIRTILEALRRLGFWINPGAAGARKLAYRAPGAIIIGGGCEFVLAFLYPPKNPLSGSLYLFITPAEHGSRARIS